MEFPRHDFFNLFDVAENNDFVLELVEALLINRIRVFQIILNFFLNYLKSLNFFSQLLVFYRNVFDHLHQNYIVVVVVNDLEYSLGHNHFVVDFD